MRILFANGYPVWANSLPWGFRQLGHPVEILPLIEPKSLNQTMRKFKPDVVLTAGWISEYTPAKLALLKKTARQYGCLQAYWATEDINHLRRWSIPLVKKLQPDVVFTINAACISAYRELGIPAFHLDFGYNPDVSAGPAAEPLACFSHEIALIANCYPSLEAPHKFRTRCLEILLYPLLEKNYDVALYGRNWENSVLFQQYPPSQIAYQGAIPFADTFRVYQTAKIILNLQNQNLYPTQVTSRTFEIIGSGGFQLTARTPALEKLFVHRQHLVMSASAEETLALVDYYLQNEEERKEIALNGQKLVLAKHTYRQRAETFLTCLKKIRKK